MVVGIEVKASATVNATDFRSLKTRAGKKFAFAIVLYDGTDVVPFGDRLAALPLSCLWRRNRPQRPWRFYTNYFALV
ncbi:hypothetical protein ATY29_15675 [Rhizobium hidalgonense]|nr:hypothetical protein ATY29_15675 [Rhizobium hidalgonense]